MGFPPLNSWNSTFSLRFNRLQTYCKPIYRGLITDGTYIWEAGCRSAREIARRANGGASE